ncbi:hypothetical protein G9A89_023133 [Geosiphon pyriformis]|nr:hypothetical protein G9A89_023133 [Geosiphon pyriformis]
MLCHLISLLEKVEAVGSNPLDHSAPINTPSTLIPTIHRHHQSQQQQLVERLKQPPRQLH